MQEHKYIKDSLLANEQILLKYLIKDTSNFNKIYISDFTTDKSKKIFKVLERLQKEGINYSLRNFVIIKDKFEYDSITVEHIKDLEQIEVQDNKIQFYKEEMKHHLVKDKVYTQIIPKLLEEARSKDNYDLEKLTEIYTSLGESIYELTNTQEGRKVISLSDALDEYINNLEKRRYSDNFHTSGCPVLDDLLATGFETGYFYIIFSESGIGKTAYFLHLVNGWINLNIPCLLVESEMTLDSVFDRIISNRYDFPAKFFHGRVPDELGNYIPPFVFDKLEKAREHFKAYTNFRYVKKSSISLNELEKIIIDTKRELDTDYLYLGIDLFTMIKDFEGDNKASRYEDAVNKFDDLLKRENISSLCVVQSRKGYSDKVKVESIEDLEKFRPHYNQIKNAHALYERARIVLSLFRAKHFAEMYLKDSPEYDLIEDIAEVDILKQNMGNLAGRAKYLFEGKNYKFYDYIDNPLT